MIEWTKQLSVGNRIIDSIHKEMFAMINRAAHQIKAKDLVALAETFDLLDSYLCRYFAVEEKIAQAAGFDFGKHRLAHQNLLNEIEHMKHECREKISLWSAWEEKNYIDSLEFCWVRHIREDARPLKVILDTHFYDFKPDCLNLASLDGKP